MGKSIFVTYKYSDANVQALPRIFGPTTARYYVDDPGCNSISWMTGNVFQMIRDNMFNIKPSKADTRQCNGATIYEGYSSYIHAVKWEDFRQDMTRYIQIADGIKEKIADYEIKKLIN